MFGACPVLEKILVKVVHHEPAVFSARHSHDQITLIWWSAGIKWYKCTARSTLARGSIQSVLLGIGAHVVCRCKVAGNVIVHDGLVTDEEVLHWGPILIIVHRETHVRSIVAA